MKKHLYLQKRGGGSVENPSGVCGICNLSRAAGNHRSMTKAETEAANLLRKKLIEDLTGH